MIPSNINHSVDDFSLQTDNFVSQQSTDIPTLGKRMLPLIQTCLEGSSHVPESKRRKSNSYGFNLIEALDCAKSSPSNLYSPVHTQHLISISSGPPKETKDGPHKTYHTEYKLLTNQVTTSNRVKVLNNKLLSHIEGLNYSKYAKDPLPPLSVRLKNLKEQMKFSAKYKVLTFKLLLLVTQNKGLVVGTNKTIMQTSCYEDEDTTALLRSTGSLFEGTNKKKGYEECHISCLPSLIDDSKISLDLDNTIATFDAEVNGLLISDRNDVSAFVNTHFKSCENIKPLIKAFELYFKALRDDSYDFTCQDSIGDLIPYYKKEEGPKAKANRKCLSFTQNIEFFNKSPKNSWRLKDDEIARIDNEINSLNQDYTDAAKVIKANKNKPKGLIDRKEATRANEKIEQNVEDYCNKLRKYIVNNYDLLLPILERTIEKQTLSELKVFSLWVNSVESPKEKIKKIAKLYGCSDSQIPANSTLGLMLSTTLAMPSEINHQIDNYTDQINGKTAQLISEFSQIKGSASETLEEYVNKYINLLKTTYEGIRNNTTPDDTLEDLIEKVDDEKDLLENFIRNYLKEIAAFYEKNVTNDLDKYDETFEKSVLGNFNPEDLLKTISELKYCDKCWVITSENESKKTENVSTKIFKKKLILSSD